MIRALFGCHARGRMIRDSRRASALPDSLPPRGLHRLQAAEYVGISVTKFDEMVKDGRMPQPIAIDGRRVWDRWLIDKAFTRLSEPDRSSWAS
jgi:predicted DNA-binding transcriptional regulator AlpA